MSTASDDPRSASGDEPWQGARPYSQTPASRQSVQAVSWPQWCAVVAGVVVALGAVVYRPLEFVVMGAAVAYLAVVVAVVAGADRSGRP